MKPFTIDQNTSLCFCTDTIVGWQYVFTSPQAFDIIISSWKYCQRQKGLLIHGFVIMPNHLHAIFSARKNNLSDIIRDYKRFTAQMILSLLSETNNTKLLHYFHAVGKRLGEGNDHKVWQAGSHPEGIVNQEFFLQKLSYIHDNPVRKGYVAHPEHWQYSSARNYLLRDHSLLNVTMIE